MTNWHKVLHDDCLRSKAVDMVDDAFGSLKEISRAAESKSVRLDFDSGRACEDTAVANGHA